MEGLTLLVLLSTAMFFGCYLAGLIPLAVTFSEKKLRFVTVLGAGLLVGTSLAVILPEGVEAIYKVKIEDLVNQKRLELQSAAAQLPVATAAELPLNKPADLTLPKLKNQSIQGKQPESPTVDKNAVQVRKKRAVGSEEKGHHHHHATGELAAQHSHGETKSDDHHDHDHSGVETHSLIGLTLVAGFILMLIVDQISQRHSNTNSFTPGKTRNDVTATIGLVVHAAADGIALGASSNASHSDIQLIVFIAIMLHKAPAAFGLVSFLLHEGLERNRIKKHLLAFALAAPIAAIITTLGISQSGVESGSSSLKTTGILMLFSAGTFLYVATVHVLPEIVSHGVSHSHLPSSTEPPSGGSHGGSFSCWELVALTSGALLPAFLSLGHSH